MKPTARLRSFLLGSSLLAAPLLNAQSIIVWDGNAGTTAQIDGAGAWFTANQWWNGATNVTWASGDSAIFGNGGAGGAVSLAGATAVGSLTFNYFTGTYTLGTAAQEITLSSGITKNAGAGAVTFQGVSPIKLSAAQTFTNNSSTNLTIGALDLDGNALTVTGTGVTTFDGNAANVISDAGGIIKNGTGSLILDGGTNVTHTFTGGITINGGSVRQQTGANVTGRGNVTINSGYIGARFGSGSNATWAGGLGTGTTAIQILGGTSGFSGEGGTGSTFTITSAGALKWGATGVNGATGFFNPTVLLLGGDQGMNTNAKGTLANAIDLNGTTRTITSLQTNGDGADTTGFTVTGAISNTAGTAAGLIKTGAGAIILTAANTYNGATTINGGSIILSGTNGAISGTTSLALSGGGTLRLVNTANTQRFADVAVTVSAGGTISYGNTSGAINYAESFGAVTVSGGLLNVVQSANQASTGSQTLTFGIAGTGNLAQSGTGSIAFSAATTGPQASGNKNMFVVFGSGTTTAGQIIGPWATTGTTAAAQTDYAVYNSNYVVPAAIAATAESTWTTAANTYTAGLTGLVGTTLGATRNITALKLTASTSALAGVVFAGAAATDYITVTGSTFANGDVVSFGGTAPGGLTTGIPYYVMNSGTNGAGTFTVSATSGGALIDLTSAGTSPNVIAGITLASGRNLGTTGILNSTGAGLTIGKGTGGVVTLPSTTSANLYMNTGNTAAIIVGAPIADNGAGILTLVKTGTASLRLIDVNTYTGNTAINAGTLQIGVNGIANGAKLGGATGIYAGNIFIGAGASLDFQTNADQTLSGVISGDGQLLKRYIGTLTLTGANTYTGKTTIGAITNAGDPTLVVSSFNSVVGGTASSSLGAPTTVANGTIEMGSNNSSPNPTLRYVGLGETTDRVINFTFNSGALRTLDASGASGLLKFTSAFTGSTTTGGIVLRGTGAGEITQGLPFAFLNLTKSDAGTWTLGGAVGSTGLITVNAGTLALQKRVSLQGGLESNWTAAKINVKSAATLALNVDSADVNGLSANSLNTLLTNISVASGAAVGLQLGARLGLDTSTATGGTFTQGNLIANSTGANGGAIGLTKLGTGILVLDKANTYTGTTLVNAGTLVVNGSTSTSSAVTVASGATLKGQGTVGGSVTINGGGTFAPGTSIESIASGNLALLASSTFAQEIDKSAALGISGDLAAVTGTMDITSSAILTLTELGTSGAWTAGDKITLIGYSTGTWNGGLFTYLGNTLNDDSSITFSGMSWTFNYNDTAFGDNYQGDLAAFTVAARYVTMTAVPEPRAALLGGLGLLMLLRRRR